jgi:hypothetical protein
LLQRIGQVDLGRFLQNDIVIEPERPRDFDRDGNAQGGCADNNVRLQWRELVGQCLTDMRTEFHPHVDDHHQ